MRLWCPLFSMNNLQKTTKAEIIVKKKECCILKSVIVDHTMKHNYMARNWLAVCCGCGMHIVLVWNKCFVCFNICFRTVFWPRTRILFCHQFIWCCCLDPRPTQLCGGAGELVVVASKLLLGDSWNWEVGVVPFWTAVRHDATQQFFVYNGRFYLPCLWEVDWTCAAALRTILTLPCACSLQPCFNHVKHLALLHSGIIWKA